MTEAEKKVRERCPDYRAAKFRKKFLIIDPYGEREGPSIEGEGVTEAAAWADAAERLEQQR
ncbi:MAG TPA: hypothetical protein VFW94_23420 [Candidatus Acidoferrales bacterium]|nr:hypothetical protein [Candidatus Acidoferrales bacterium]